MVIVVLLSSPRNVLERGLKLSKEKDYCDRLEWQFLGQDRWQLCEHILVWNWGMVLVPQPLLQSTLRPEERYFNLGHRLRFIH